MKTPNKLTRWQKIQAFLKGNCTTCGSVKVERGYRGQTDCRNKKCDDKNNYWRLYER